MKFHSIGGIHALNIYAKEIFHLYQLTLSKSPKTTKMSSDRDPKKSRSEDNVEIEDLGQSTRVSV